jgi:hypothetical protein
MRVKDMRQPKHRTSKVQSVFHCNVTSDKRLFAQERVDQGNKKQECFIRLSKLNDVLTQLQEPHCKNGE